MQIDNILCTFLLPKQYVLLTDRTVLFIAVPSNSCVYVAKSVVLKVLTRYH